MRLYHGTVHEFDAPDPGMGREATDFGVGFYATDSERMAESFRVQRYDKRDGCQFHLA